MFAEIPVTRSVTAGVSIQQTSKPQQDETAFICQLGGLPAHLENEMAVREALRTLPMVVNMLRKTTEFQNLVQSLDGAVLAVSGNEGNVSIQWPKK